MTCLFTSQSSSSPAAAGPGPTNTMHFWPVLKADTAARTLTVCVCGEATVSEVGTQGGVVSVVGGQCDVHTGREEKWACHGEEVENTGRRGAMYGGRESLILYSVPSSTSRDIPPTCT